MHHVSLITKPSRLSAAHEGEFASIASHKIQMATLGQWDKLEEWALDVKDPNG
jgi:hypothetical protein